MTSGSMNIRPLAMLAASTLLVFYTGLGAALAETPDPDKSTASARKRPSSGPESTAHTMEGVLEKHFSDESSDPAAKVLRDAHFTYNRVLVAEALPGDKAFLVEIALANKDVSLRYPVKLERDGSATAPRWRIAWTPDPAYARALARISQPKTLAGISAGKDWSKIHRLPAFPIIVGSDYLVTPFGRIDATKTDMTRHPQADGLRVSQKLTRQVQRWTGQISQDDPGSANVDILLLEGVSWKQATQAMMAPAMEGLFRIYFIGRGARDIHAVSAAAPVIKGLSSGRSSVVIAVSSAGKRPKTNTDRYAIRIRVGENILSSAEKDSANSDEADDSLGGAQKTEKADGCRPDATFCTDSVEDFGARSGHRIRSAIKGHKEPVTRVMVAATGDVPAVRLVEFLAALGNALDLPAGKIFTGYIGR